ncbi:hypothetical protein [Comamonas aquatica]|uniref:hypothetical protein n=1 Tax=Comamonas aquatica TaxID=225991 RepID=UPI001EF33106|nr:hypothetical protein [Comamonas aquatica]
MIFDEKLNFNGSNWIKENGQIILNVEESHALIMAAGYLKHNNEDGIYFRGQRKIYDDLSPGLYRGIKMTPPSMAVKPLYIKK